MRFEKKIGVFGCVVCWTMISLLSHAERPEDRRYFDPLNVTPEHISTDKSVKLDYDIVYVRAPRRGDKGRTYWAEVFHPAKMDAGADLMLLHPDGTEEVLVKAGEKESITDPFVSFDGQWVYYAKFHDLTKMVTNQVPVGGSDIYKIHVKSRKVVQLTRQEFTPNTGAAVWSKDFVTREQGKTNMNYGVYNLGPCPLPGRQSDLHQQSQCVQSAEGLLGSDVAIVCDGRRRQERRDDRAS